MLLLILNYSLSLMKYIVKTISPGYLIPSDIYNWIFFYFYPIYFEKRWISKRVPCCLENTHAYYWPVPLTYTERQKLRAVIKKFFWSSASMKDHSPFENEIQWACYLLSFSVGCQQARAQRVTNLLPVKGLSVDVLVHDGLSVSMVSDDQRNRHHADARHAQGNGWTCRTIWVQMFDQINKL